MALVASLIILYPSATVSAPTEQVATTTPEVSEDVSRETEWTFDALVHHLAIKYGQDEAIARKIISCESQYSDGSTHKNYTKEGVHWSTDWGYWQVNDYWHLEASTALGFDVRYNWEDNLEYGFMLLKNDGAMRHWSASAYCWNI